MRNFVTAGETARKRAHRVSSRNPPISIGLVTPSPAPCYTAPPKSSFAAAVSRAVAAPQLATDHPPSHTKKSTRSQTSNTEPAHARTSRQNPSSNRICTLVLGKIGYLSRYFCRIFPIQSDPSCPSAGILDSLSRRRSNQDGASVPAGIARPPPIRSPPSSNT